MDFDCRLENLRKEVDALCKSYEEARDFTQGFLDCCKKHRIKLVSIQMKTKEIQESMSFPFGAKGSVFAEEKENNHYAIWRVCDEYNIGGGAGNASQMQISSMAQCKLIDGVYRLKDGKWFKEE